MNKRTRKFIITLLIIGGIYYAIDYFDIHIQEYDPELIEQLDQRKKESGAIRNEQIYEEKQNTFEGTTEDVIRLVNFARKESGVGELASNEQLAESAMLKAKDMKEKEYFEHVNPQGLDMGYFVNAAGYKFSTIGENLAEGYFSAQSVHDAWMNSEGHKENVLSGDFEEIGVAILEIEKEGARSYLAVQHFGTELGEIVQQPVQEATVCDKKIKKNCKNAKKNREEVKEAIEKQEEIIEDSEDEGFSEKDLRDLYENLEKLEEIKDDLKDYLKDCEKIFEKCDQWE